MSDNIKITDTPDGGCIVEMDGETICYSKEEIEEMERDYKDAILRLLNQNTRNGEVCKNVGQKEKATLSAAIAEVIDGLKLHIEKIGAYDNETVKAALREDLGQLIEIHKRLS